MFWQLAFFNKRILKNERDRLSFQILYLTMYSNKSIVFGIYVQRKCTNMADWEISIVQNFVFYLIYPN